MAKALWEQKITKHTNWAGDSSTGGDPVSGKVVQEFIKEALESKFGHLVYNKSSRKYYVFADEENYKLWEGDNVTYAKYLLATFDAPAPATISIRNHEDTTSSVLANQNRTITLGTTGQRIQFNYRITDSNDRAISEAVIMRVLFATNTNSETFTQTYAANPLNADSGTLVDFNIDKYLKTEGNYTITITLTGASTQATATVTFTCNVVDLSFKTTFDNLEPIDYSNRWFYIPYTVNGGSGFSKIVEIYVDGERLYQNGLGWDNAVSSGDPISRNSTAAQIIDNLSLYIKDTAGDDATWPASGTWSNGARLANAELAGKKIFGPGKHSLQLYTYISLDTETTVKSQTSYYEFVVIDKESVEEGTYLLYSTNLAQGQTFSSGQAIQLEATQFVASSFSVSVIDTRGRDVQIFYNIYKKEQKSEGIVETLIYTAKPIVSSGTSNTLNYTFRDAGDMVLRITNNYSDDNLVAEIAVAESSAKVEETTSGNIFKYTALNRQNGDENEAVWTNESVLYKQQYAAAASFNENVLFVDGQTGWTGEALRLKNGATVTFPINIFSPKDTGNNIYDLKNSGLSFEIEFTTSNVLNDNARILEYSDEANGNGSYIKITATSAEIRSNKGASIKTNFKENERIKLAFIINPIRTVTNGQVRDEDKGGIKYPNTLMIMVNGVLDRACRWGEGQLSNTQDNFIWTGTVGNSFTIGDLDGQATVDLASVRIYNKSLNLDEEFMNYMYDSNGTELETIFDKNNILDESGNISFNAVKDMIPTMVMSIDYTSINTGESKKDNYAAEVQYWDKNDPTGGLNFYARNCWVSCQGTSSMKYPTKNLRLYFGKTANKASKSNVKDAINSSGERVGTAPAAVTTAEFETEFFPFGVYGADNENNMHEYADNIMPYSTNKKVDGPDGVEPFSGNTGVIHEGYHKVGGNLTATGKFNLIKNYVELTDEFFEKQYEKDENGKEVFTGVWADKNHTPEFYVLKNGAESAALKAQDAFGNEYKIYASGGFMGYLYNSETDSYSKDYEELSIDLFELAYISKSESYKITTVSGRDLGNADTYLENNDIYISAYRPLADSLRPFDINGKSNELWQYEKELRYSGAKFYYRIEKRDAQNRVTSVKYKECKKKKPLDKDEFYFSLGTYWRQYNEAGHVSGWTDRWTLKADFAESSMCHNSGVARLWGNAMKNLAVGTEYPCQTSAQQAVAKAKDAFGEPGIIDIRTSCDGKPIVLFYKQLLGYDQTTGKPVYGDSVYGGLFNIMTDKSSTKLFGFEDIYSDDAMNLDGKAEKPVFKASKVQCWECLQNGSGIPQGASLAFDKTGMTVENMYNVKKSKLGEDRLIFNAYESRFPDTGQERHEFNPADTREAAAQAAAAAAAEGKTSDVVYEGGDLGDRWPDDVYGVETNALESFLRWLNFCQPAVKYTIGENGQTIDGYNGNLYNPITLVSAADEARIDQITKAEDVQDHNTALYYYLKYTEAEEALKGDTTEEEERGYKEDLKRYNLFLKWNDTGNDAYAGLGTEYVAGVDENGENITDTVKFDKDNLGAAASFTWYSFAYGINYEVVSKEVNNTSTGIIQTDVYMTKMDSFDSKYRFLYSEDGQITKDEELAANYKVDVYLTPTSDGRLKYVDETGTEQTTTFAAVELDSEDYLRNNGNSWKNRTYMDFFSATKGEHLDLNKMAAYYVYVIRFGAVDQVVKNTMMTTEDGQHWYFINYDNDTVLGVRNDGHLVYNWDFNRDTFDTEILTYAFAGAKSALWNNLEMDDDFMALVKTIDQQMYQQGLLSAEAVLTYLNEKQEGVWCERLYNAQEEKKYISTFTQDFTLTNYLAFMHGTRHSHRTWWVTKRWDLYDSKWNTGLYASQQMHWYFAIGSAQERQPMYLMTAASDYTFETWANLNAKDGWNVSLKGNETYLFEIPKGEGLVVGDPMRMYGPQKIKVMNMRPINYSNTGSVGGTTNMSVGIVVRVNGEDKLIDWVSVSGSTMTKLLIGSDDEEKTNGIKGLDGLNKVYSLEELDIRNCPEMTSLLINDLSNLHRFRATGSSLGEFSPAKGSVFYEVSLPTTITSLVLEDVIFKTDPSEYIVYQGGEIKKYNGSEVVTSTVAAEKLLGGSADNVIDALPKIYMRDAANYCYTYVEENGIPTLVQCNTEDIVGKGYVFDYKPNTALRSISFKNVSGLDTYSFFNDWYKALETTNFVQNGKCTLPITLEGIQWVIGEDPENAENTPAKQLIAMYNKFTWNTDKTGKELFSGKVFLTSMSPEDYNLLIAKFGDDVFKSGGLTVSTTAQAFFNAKTSIVPVEERVNGNMTPVYTIISGTKFEVQANVFPVSSTINYVYKLGLETASTEIPYNVVGVGGLTAPGEYPMLNDEHNKEVFGFEGLTLTNANGTGTLYADPTIDAPWQSKSIFYIEVSEYNADGSIQPYGLGTTKRIYVRFAEKVLPKLEGIKIKDGENSPATSFTFNKKETHDMEVVFDKNEGKDVNVPIKSATISFASNSVSHEKGNGDATITIPDAKNPLEFTLDYNIAAFYENSSLPIYVTVVFDDLTSTRFTKTFDVEIQCIPAIAVGMYDDDHNLYSSTNLIKINDINPKIIPISLLVNESLGVDEPNIDYTLTSTIVRQDNISNADVSIVETTVDSKTVPAVKIDIARSFIASTDIFDGQIKFRIVATSAVGTIGTGNTEIFEAVVNVVMPNVVVLSRQIGPTEDDVVLSTSNEFNYNLAKGEHIEWTDITILGISDGGHTPTVKTNVEIDSITIGTGTEPINGASIATASKTNPCSVEVNNVKYDVAPYKKDDELLGFSIRVGEPSTFLLATDDTVTVHCSVGYDENEQDELEGTGNVTGEIQFHVIRSMHSGTSYKGLKTVDDGGTFYAVDKNNRFFEFSYDGTSITSVFYPYAITATGNTSAEAITGNASGTDANPFGDWRGVGFVKANPSDESRPIPVFISFITYIKSPIAVTDSAKFTNEPFYNGDITLRNGFAETANIVSRYGNSSYDDIYSIVYNRYNGEMKQYVPSLREVEDIWSGGTGSYENTNGNIYPTAVPSEEVLALDALVKFLIDHKFIKYAELKTATNVTNSKITFTTTQLYGLYDINELFNVNTGATNRSVLVETSTLRYNVQNYIYGYDIVKIVDTSTTPETVYYQFQETPGRMIGHQYHTLIGLVVPFLNVK